MGAAGHRQHGWAFATLGTHNSEPMAALLQFRSFMAGFGAQDAFNTAWGPAVTGSQPDSTKRLAFAVALHRQRPLPAVELAHWHQVLDCCFACASGYH